MRYDVSPWSILPFEDAHGYVGPGAGLAVDRSSPGVLDLKRGVLEMLGDRPLQLPEREDRLHQAGGSHRMTAGDQAARRVDRNRPLAPQLEPVVDARHERLARSGEGSP